MNEQQTEMPIIESDHCPICGDIVVIIGKTKDGRLIGSCNDAFMADQWNSKEEAQ